MLFQNRLLRLDKNAEINHVPVTSHGQSWFEQMHSGAKWKP